MDPVAVFDIVSRLVDKSLVAVDERPGGAQHYRLLETLRAYAIERARAAGELVALRDAHLAFWVDWLESQEAELHTDRVIETVEMFHDSLAAALDWSTRDPAVGLHLLRRLGRPWQGMGRPDASLAAVDTLLTEENAERFPMLWVAAALSVAVLVGTARGWPAPLMARTQDLAEANGDEYWVVLCDWLFGYTEDNSRRLRELAHERGRALRRVSRHDLAGSSCRRDSERRVDHARRAPTSGPRRTRAAIYVTPPTVRPAEPRSPWAISSGASRSRTGSARPRRC